VVRLEKIAASAGAAGARNGNGHDGGATAALARELDAIEKDVRAELSALGEIERALDAETAETQAAATGGQHDRPGNGGTAPDDQAAETILLHTTLANYRRRAGRLRDELEGMRRRVESLSVSEISGYLEELGEDLAELEK
jgi:hypothetical protein